MRVFSDIWAICLVIIQLYAMRKDRVEWVRDKIAEASVERLRLRLRWTYVGISTFAIVPVLLIMPARRGTIWNGLSLFSGFMYSLATFLMLTRSILVARREHRALRMAYIREIMES